MAEEKTLLTHYCVCLLCVPSVRASEQRLLVFVATLSHLLLLLLCDLYLLTWVLFFNDTRVMHLAVFP